MKKNTCVLLALTLTGLASCAGPESYKEKMARYTPQTIVGKNQVPEFDSQGFQFTTAKPTRSPASAGHLSSAKDVGSIPTDDVSLSNKKLYFLTLFGQYESMKQYAQEFAAPSVNICPHFHTSLLEHKGKRTGGIAKDVTPSSDKKFSYDAKKLSDADYLSKRPELYLPLSKDEVTPKVIDIFRAEGATIAESKMDEVVHKALDIHLSKTYAEIRELCEFGVSDNYYIYENLITHIKNSEFKPASTNMNTLLKTTLFSNIALVTSLEKIHATPMRSIASTVPKKKDVSSSSPYANEVMTRLSVEWAKEYFDHLK